MRTAPYASGAAREHRLCQAASPPTPLAPTAPPHYSPRPPRWTPASAERCGRVVAGVGGREGRGARGEVSRMKFVPSVLGGDVSGCLACPGGLLTRRVDVAELVRDRRTERVQLQRLLGDPVRMLARTRTETRGNPARGARVPATKPSFLPRGTARRLHAVACDRDVPRQSSSRQMCARSCRMRAHRLHRFPGGLLHPTVDLAFECEMPNMTSEQKRCVPTKCRSVKN